MLRRVFQAQARLLGFGRGGGGARGWRLQEAEDEDFAVGVKRPTRSSLGFLQRAFRQEVRNLGDETSTRERFLDVIALEVDVRIDLVRDAIVTLVSLETDVMGGGAHP